MPNKWTFQMKPVQKVLERVIGDGKGWVDPFAGKTSPAEITNDANCELNTTYHMDALAFLTSLEDAAYLGVLFDPPYSVEMAKRRYQYQNYTDTASFARYMTTCKAEIGRITKYQGHVISFGWNSNGIGMKYGFNIDEIIMLAHGAHHYDTIIVVETKTNRQMKLGWL